MARRRRPPSCAIARRRRSSVPLDEPLDLILQADRYIDAPPARATADE